MHFRLGIVRVSRDTPRRLSRSFFRAATPSIAAARPSSPAFARQRRRIDGLSPDASRPGQAHAITTMEARFDSLSLHAGSQPREPL